MVITLNLSKFFRNLTIFYIFIAFFQISNAISYKTIYDDPYINLKFCEVSGQYISKDQTCQRWCSYTNSYFTSITDYNSKCVKTNTNNNTSYNNFYCSLNGVTYNNGSDYNNNCTYKISYYCQVNGQSYFNMNDYNNNCRSTNNYNSTYWCQSLNRYISSNQSCPSSSNTYYCSLNNNTYYSISDYNNNCRSNTSTYYCSANNMTYYNIYDYNNSCRSGSANYYCSSNGRTYYSLGEFQSNCQNSTNNTKWCQGLNRYININEACPNNNETKIVSNSYSNLLNNSVTCNATLSNYTSLYPVVYFEFTSDLSNINKTTNKSLSNDVTRDFSQNITDLKSGNYYCRGVAVLDNKVYTGQWINFSISNTTSNTSTNTYNNFINNPYNNKDKSYAFTTAFKDLNNFFTSDKSATSQKQINKTTSIDESSNQCTVDRTSYNNSKQCLNQDTDIKNGSNVITTDSFGFLPHSLVEWLTFIILIFVIFVLVKKVKENIHGDRSGEHH